MARRQNRVRHEAKRRAITKTQARAALSVGAVVFCLVAVSTALPSAASALSAGAGFDALR
jgi:hypothetical protein